MPNVRDPQQSNDSVNREHAHPLDLSYEGLLANLKSRVEGAEMMLRLHARDGE